MTESKPGFLRRRHGWAIALAMLAALAAGFLIGRRGAAGAAKPAPQTAAPEAADIKWWTCAMHPEIHAPGPGRCPKCGMDLIPVRRTSAGSDLGLRVLTVTPEARALMEIETAPVERRFVTTDVRMVGKVAYDETRLSYITAWVGGRIDRLYVDYTGIAVRKGDHMVYLYSPELLSAQEELLQAIRASQDMESSKLELVRERTKATIDASREKLRLLGLTAEQVAEIEKRGKPDVHLTIYAPTGGIVVQKNAQEGMYVQTGTRIYTLAKLDEVWVQIDAYESDLPWVRYGQAVRFETESYPGREFTGRVAFISPFVDPRTRTVKVRVNVPNREGLLKPDMFVRAVVRAEVAAGGRVMDPALAGKWICPMHPEVIRDDAGECPVCGMPLVRTETLGYVSASPGPEDEPLVIPRSAPLVTGKRAVVYVELPGRAAPTFEGREIVLGPRAGDYYIVQYGLKEGERVVVRGNFKIDSSLQIEARPSMMLPEGGAGTTGPAEGAGSGAASPGPFLDQFAAIDRAYGLVIAGAGKRNAEDLAEAFRTLRATLEGVDASSLTGRAAAEWKELSMLLRNDAVIGAEARTEDDVGRAVAALKDHYARLCQTFPRPPVPAGGYETPEAFRRQLSAVLDAYMAVGSALAADDETRAAAAGKDFSRALSAVDMKLLGGAAHTAWMKHAASLAKAAGALAAAQDLEAQRRAFALAGEALAVVTRDFPAPEDGPLYRLHCPMAFGGRGADWLQRDRKVRNPYFGAAMPECGSVTETLRPAAPAKAGAGGHE